MGRGKGSKLVPVKYSFLVSAQRNSWIFVVPIVSFDFYNFDRKTLGIVLRSLQIFSSYSDHNFRKKMTFTQGHLLLFPFF